MFCARPSSTGTSKTSIMLRNAIDINVRIEVAEDERKGATVWSRFMTGLGVVGYRIEWWCYKLALKFNVRGRLEYVYISQSYTLTFQMLNNLIHLIQLTMRWA